MTELALKALLSYLLGSLMGSLIVGRLRGGVDIRTLGSGNAGATNALRTQGKAVGLTVLVIDLAKGWIATALIAPWHPLTAVPAGAGALHDLAAANEAALGWAPADALGWAQAACGLAVMLGHVYPLFFGFRGGKGVATLIGAVSGISAWLLLPMILTWFVVVVVSGYVSLASMAGAVALVVAIGLLHTSVDRDNTRLPMLLFAALSALLIIYTHRSNITRIRAGTESRARRLWRFGRNPGPG
ncbi:MAG: glycerol-3-phosphate 1-O-acyltransferase PlsY [Proteobacteria bacterium]|nr:glycerol-3-phosphate 1-O-acyltransferase PlsY [Pseudomonadota bacterium]